MYIIYVNSPLYDCFMTFVMYILDGFIARMGLRCKQIRERFTFTGKDVIFYNFKYSIDNKFPKLNKKHCHETLQKSNKQQ